MDTQTPIPATPAVPTPVQQPPKPKVRSPLSSTSARLFARLVDLGILLVILLLSGAGTLFEYFHHLALHLPTLPETIMGYEYSVPLIIGLLLLTYLTLTQFVILIQAGQTIGKRFTGIRIVRRNTEKHPGFIRTIFVRGLFNTLLWIIPPYALADALSLFIRKDLRTLHDLLAGTEVVDAV